MTSGPTAAATAAALGGGFHRGVVVPAPVLALLRLVAQSVDASAQSVDADQSILSGSISGMTLAYETLRKNKNSRTWNVMFNIALQKQTGRTARTAYRDTRS